MHFEPSLSKTVNGRITLDIHPTNLRRSLFYHLHDFLENLRFTLRNYHASELVNNQDILFRWHFAESLNEELKNVLRRFWCVLKTDRNVT